MLKLARMLLLTNKNTHTFTLAVVITVRRHRQEARQPSVFLHPTQHMVLTQEPNQPTHYTRLR